MRSARPRPTYRRRLTALLSVLSMAAALAVAAVPLTAPADAASCAVCVGIVTTYDPDGTAGPQAPVTRYYKNLLVDVPYSLDVDGTKGPAPFVGLLQPLISIVPGYEINVTVLAVDPDKPTITITRLGHTPDPLPLRVEVVTGDRSSDAATKQSIGYDDLDSTAPTTFKAAIDLSNRDHDATTSQVKATLTTTGAPKRMTVAEEEFTGDPGGARQNDASRRMTFSGDGTTTTVPATIGLDLTTSDTVTHAILSHSGRTDLGFDIASPGGLPRTTGSLGELPANVDLTLTDTDLDGDGVPDKKVDYVASGTTAHAALKLQTAAQTTDVAIADLPATVHLGTAISDDRTGISYHADSRATKADVTSTDGDSVFKASVDDVPANISELSSTSTADGGVITYDADSRAGDATITSDKDGKHAVIGVDGVPKALTVHYSSTDSEGHYSYATSGDLADHATLDYTDAAGQHFVLGADQIPSTLSVDYTSTTSGGSADGQSDLGFSYRASTPIPHAELTATHLVNLIDRATSLDVSLDDIPTAFDLGVHQQTQTQQTLHTPIDPPQACSHEPDPEDDPRCPQFDGENPTVKYKTTTAKTSDLSLSATTPGDTRLGHGEFQVTSGPDDHLDATNEIGTPQDGVLYENTAAGYVISGRISQFDQLHAQTHTVDTHTVTPRWGQDDLVADATPTDTLHADMDTDALGHALELRVDQQPADGSSAVVRTEAHLASLPHHISLDNGTVNGLDQTVWNASSSVHGYSTASIDGQYRSGFELRHSTLDGGDLDPSDNSVSIDPMPKNFTACQSGDTDTCAQGIFDANLSKAHNGATSQEIDDECATGNPLCHNWPTWFFRTFACFGSESCDNPVFNAQPGDANNGTVRLQADEPITIGYVKGDYVHNAGIFTTLHFENLTRFVLQAHDSGEYDCGSTFGDCRFGTVDLDTDGHAITGSIEQTSGNGAYFNFPSGFSASHLVWVFKQTGDYSGRHATLGSMTCPSGTIFQTGSEDLTGRMCDGDLT